MLDSFVRKDSTKFFFFGNIALIQYLSFWAATKMSRYRIACCYARMCTCHMCACYLLVVIDLSYYMIRLYRSFRLCRRWRKIQ